MILNTEKYTWWSHHVLITLEFCGTVVTIFSLETIEMLVHKKGQLKTSSYVDVETFNTILRIQYRPSSKIEKEEIETSPVKLS